MLTPQSTNEVLLALEGAGLIDRRPDPADRRVRRVFLTAAGRRVLADTHPRVRELEARMVTGMSSRECAQLRTWLVRAAQALEASSSQPPDSSAGRPARSSPPGAASGGP
jgi:DNA-binding MarR family transcriptional regulator